MILNLINGLLRGLFDVLLYPFRSLPPLVGLTVVSLVAAIGMLLVFKATSNQDKIAAVKRRIHASLFEIRLFNDDLVAILRAQMEILRHNVTYMRLSLVPMVWMMVPLVLVIAQLQFHYGYTGLAPGDSTLVKVQLAGAEKPAGGFLAEPVPRPDVSLELPAGLRQDSPPVWIPALGEMAWRIVVEEEGDYELTVKVNGAGSQTKSLSASGSVVRRAPQRLGPGFVNQLLYPAENRLPPEAAIASITVIYPDAEVSILGFPLHWMIIFFLLSIVFAFILRNRFGVTI